MRDFFPAIFDVSLGVFSEKKHHADFCDFFAPGPQWKMVISPCRATWNEVFEHFWVKKVPTRPPEVSRRSKVWVEYWLYRIIAAHFFWSTNHSCPLAGFSWLAQWIPHPKVPLWLRTYWRCWTQQISLNPPGSRHFFGACCDFNGCSPKIAADCPSKSP